MRRHHGPVAVRETAGNLRVTDHDGLLWTLRPIDPDWPMQLRRVVAEVRIRDRRWADLIVRQLPPMWRDAYDRGQVLA